MHFHVELFLVYVRQNRRDLSYMYFNVGLIHLYVHLHVDYFLYTFTIM